MSQRFIRPRDLRASSLGRRVPVLGWSLGWSLPAALALAVGLLWLLVATPAGAQQITEDTKRPRIVGAPVINSPADGEAYRAGERIIVSLSFNEPVQVSGTPRLRLTIGDRQRWARYSASSTDGESLSFAYEVKSGDRDDDGLTVKQNSLRLNGGAIVDGGGNAAKLKHKRLSGLSNHRVDGHAAGGEPQTVVKPNAPTGVKADPIGDMEVKVSWNQVNINCLDGNGSVAVKRHGFRLYDLSDDSVVIQLSVRDGNTEYTVTQLKANKMYEAEVRAYGCDMWSAPTYQKFTTTGMDAQGDPMKPFDEAKMPPNPPTNLTVETMGSSVKVSWTAAASNEGRCAHSYYALYFGRYQDVEDAPIIKWDITATEATVTPTLVTPTPGWDLEEGQQYEVYVVSRSSSTTVDAKCGSESPAAWTLYTHSTS